MERLALAREVAAHAFASFEQILREPSSIIVRDASIQRFEYTFEAIWKLAKIYLFERHGIDAGSPKGCFRELLKVGMLSASHVEQALIMTDDRNLTSHTYIEAVAVLVHSRLSGHALIMKIILDKAV
jgi:nucleotidyltransferase substrate binding protein (TIGR01987 family)